MKKIKKEILDAIFYYKNENINNLSVTAVAKMHNIDKETLFKYLEYDISFDDIVTFNGFYYLLSTKDIQAVSEYIADDSLTFSYIKKRYGFKQETFKKILEVVGYPSTRRYKNPINTNLFDEIKTEADAYFLGFFLADGYVNKSKQTARIKVSSVDVDILNKFSEYIGLDSSFIKEEFHKDTGNKQCYISIYRRNVVDNLESKGIQQAKSNKEVPYYDIKPSLIRHYIRGIFDGDGYIWKGGWQVGFSISEEVLLFIKKHFDSSLPQGYSNTKRGVYFDSESNVFRLKIQGKRNVFYVLDYLYKDATIYLDRKYDIYQDFNLNRRD